MPEPQDALVAQHAQRDFRRRGPPLPQDALHLDALEGCDDGARDAGRERACRHVFDMVHALWCNHDYRHQHERGSSKVLAQP